MRSLRILPGTTLVSICVVSFFQVNLAQAGSATWSLNPGSNDWHTAENWIPATVPNGDGDVASFGISNTTEVSVLDTTTLDSLLFNPGASAFTINTDANSALNFRGAGIINNSGIRQSFTAGPQPYSRMSDIIFAKSASAGDLVTFTVMGGIFDTMIGGEVVFRDHATAGNANFVVNPSEVVFEGRVSFLPNASAGTATFTLLGGGYNQTGGSLVFEGASSASKAHITCQGAVADTAISGADVTFVGRSSAEQAFITAEGGAVAGAPGGYIEFNGNGATAEKSFLFASGSQGAGTGGEIIFLGNSQGGAAAISLTDAGTLYVYSSDPSPGISIGTLSGNGVVDLKGKNLTVGTLSSNTSFDGLIQDYIDQGGSFTKVGGGTFRLTGANTYTGGTIVKQGALLACNTTDSATGTGSVQVLGGILGGPGIISGVVTIGSGAALEPSFSYDRGKATTLTIQSLLTLSATSTYTYKFQAKGQQLQTDDVVANGITIETGAQLNLVSLANGTPPSGTVLTVITNTSSSAISGTFANLPDGAAITVGNNIFKASYEGGDGNDLTLTVQ